MSPILAPLAVLVRPRTAFARLAERPRWVWAIALAVVMLTFVVKIALGTPQLIAQQREIMEAAGMGSSVTVENGDGERESTGEVGRAATSEDEPDEEVVVPENVQGAVDTVVVVSAYVFGSLGIVAGALALAGIIYGASRLWSSEASFAVVLGVVALAKMPDALRNVIQAVYTAATGAWVQHQGLGALVAPADITEAGSSIPYALLSHVDAFAIWFVVLLYLGLRRAVGLQRGRAAIITGGYLAITMVLAVVPAFLTGMFTPV